MRNMCVCKLCTPPALKHDISKDIYIYIYIERERERDIDRYINRYINCMCKPPVQAWRSRGRRPASRRRFPSSVILYKMAQSAPSTSRAQTIYHFSNAAPSRRSAPGQPGHRCLLGTPEGRAHQNQRRAGRCLSAD